MALRPPLRGAASNRLGVSVTLWREQIFVMNKPSKRRERAAKQTSAGL
jgi:hypothetical protein